MPRLHVMHVMMIPAGLIGLVGAHLLILVRQKHTHKPGPKATNATSSASRSSPTRR
jgi:ubiquinol-cytochrome c reductase cytochrome b subunit